MLHHQNPSAPFKGARVTRFHWRKRTLKMRKTHSSLILDIETAAGANLLIREGLVLDGEIRDVELFDPQCIITRCYNCQEFGHNAKYCKAQGRCSLCAAPGHAHTSCPALNTPEYYRCANCCGKHAAGSPQCPKQRLESEKTISARATKACFFNEPVCQVPPSTTTPVFS